MASSGAMADFARMPTRNKVLVFLLLGLLAGFLYYRMGYKKLKASVTEAKNKAQKAAGDNAALDADIPKFKELRAKKEILDALILEHSKALPTESEVPAFFETLERKITEAGVEVNKWSKRGEEPVEQFVKVPLDVEITGNFLQIKKFFASLVEKKQPKEGGPDDKGVQERERIVSIENLSLTKPTVRNREIVLTATFTAVTYRQGDAPAGSTVLPTPTNGGGTAPLPSTSAPMPSAGTPQGAKTRVEDSLNKIDQRTKDSVDKANGSDRLKGGI
jgi:Tfp pilus assembly protein PilO